MLQLGQCADRAEPEKGYREQHANGELRHPLLVSLRVRIKKKSDTAQAEGAGADNSQPQHNSTLEALVVEVEPCSLTDIPNDSVDAIHGLLAAGPALTSERFMASSLKKLAPSPFNNVLVDGQPSDKALVLLQFTQRSNGKQIANGYRIVADYVLDALEPLATTHYGTTACCSVDQSPDFTGQCTPGYHVQGRPRKQNSSCR